MSKANVYNLNCPRCGTENQVTVWDSVNVTLDPDLKEQVMKGELFEHRCPACAFTGGIAHPCLYHDMDRNLLIYLIPPQGDGGNGDLASMGADSFPAEMVVGYTMRRVATADRLREKIMIFDLGLDDRVIELCKWRLMQSLSDEDPGFRPVEAFFDPEEGGRFVVFDEDGRAMSIVFFHDWYLDIQKEFLSILDEGPNPTFQSIDAAWAFLMIDQGL